jgi:hypothetical protein
MDFFALSFLFTHSTTAAAADYTMLKESLKVYTMTKKIFSFYLSQIKATLNVFLKQ